jgi:hypothetical protein
MVDPTTAANTGAAATGAGHFIDRATIGAFAGATATILAIVVTIRKVTGFNHLAIPLALSLGLSFALGYKELTDALGWFVVVGNGCLMFLAIVGTNEMAAERPAGRGQPQGKGPKIFFGSFFK